MPVDEVVRYIIRLPNPEDKALALWSITQPHHTKARPTGILLDMFDNGQNIGCAKTTGYRLGYDFVSNTVIDEPFVPMLGLSPFHQSWSANTEAQKRTWTRFRGSPGALMEEFLHDLSPTDAHNEETVTDRGFAIIFRLPVIGWILRFYEDLQVVEPEKLTPNMRIALEAKFSELIDHLSGMPFPTQAGNDVHELNELPKADIHARSPRRWLEDEVLQIDKEEPDIRDLTLTAKAKGDKDLVERIVHYFVQKKFLAESVRDASAF